MKLMVGTGNGKARELASTTRLQSSIGMGEGETNGTALDLVALTQRTRRGYVLALSHAACYERQTLTHGLLVGGMYVVGKTHVHSHGKT